MDYNELNILIKRKNFSLKDFCSAIGITSTGLKKGIDNGSLALRYVQAACETLGVTPNEFMGWTIDESTPGVYASNISGVNTQNSNEAIQALREELKEKGGIIKEKDKQINRLLGIIERGKKP